MVKKLLIAGPDWGMEMGWRLMRWQGYVRKQSEGYDQTAVITSDEFYPLYADFAVREPTIGTRDRFRYSDVDITYLKPSKETCKGRIQQRFIRYGHGSLAGDRIAIHARHDPRVKIGNRNWPYHRWETLVRMYPQYEFVCVGHPTASMKINGCEDKRGVPLMELFEVLSSATLCMGPSSGPMHLASLCGCSHVVWTDAKRWDLGDCKGTNRMRYERVWNPFGTTVQVVDSEGWQPRVKTVALAMEEVL